MIATMDVRKWAVIALAGIMALTLTACGKKSDPTMKSFQPPPPVQAIAAIHRDDAVTLTWKYAKPSRILIRGFYIERSTGGGEFENMGFLPAEANSFEDRKITAGTAYRYRMRVYSQRDVFSESSPVLSLTPEPLPAAPADLKFRTDAEGVVISWAPSAESLKYNIYRIADRNALPAAAANTVPLTESLFRDSVPAGGSVHYYVRAVKEGSVRNEGAPSAMLEVPVSAFVPSAPRELRAARAHTQIYLSWRDVPEKWIKGYRVYRKHGAGQFVSIGTTAVPLYADQQPPQGEVVYYVVALGPAAESMPSNHAAAPKGDSAQ